MMIQFMMVRIQVRQFAVLAEEIYRGDIGLTTEISYSYSEDAHMIACLAAFRFMGGDAPLIVFDLQCEFKISDDDWARMTTPEGLAIPADLREVLAVNTIGTARGVLYCKTEGTPFNNLIIPPIDVMEMMKEDLN